MQHLKYLNVFKNIIDEYFPHHKNFIKFSSLSQKELHDLPHMIIFSKNKSILNMFLQHFLTCYHGENININQYETCVHEINVNNNKLSFEYKSNTFWIEVDIDYNNMSDCNAFCDVIKSLCSHLSFRGYRHVIILKCMMNLQDNMENALRTLLDKYVHSTFFIFKTDNLSKISNSLKNRCSIINMNIPIDMLNNISSTLIKRCRPDIPIELYDNILINSNYDLMSLCMLLELNTPSQYSGHLKSFIEIKLDDLKNKTNKPDEFAISLRDLAIKIGASCVPINMICNQVIAYVEKNNHDKLIDAISLIADMEHKCKIVNKNIFVIEGYIEKLMISILG